MDTGEKIKSARLEHHISQKKLGAAIGTSQQMIAQYENGSRKPKFETLNKIADALNVHIFSLLDDTYEMKIGVGTHYNPVTDELELEETEYIDLTDRAKLIDLYDNELNFLGKQEALKRIGELTEIKKYTAPDTPDQDTAEAANLDQSTKK